MRPRRSRTLEEMEEQVRHRRRNGKRWSSRRRNRKRTRGSRSNKVMSR